MQSAGQSVYPHKFFTDIRIPEYVEKYSGIEGGAQLEESVAVAGRIMRVAASGSKLFFYNLHADGAKIQVMADLKSSGLSEEDFAKLHGGVRRGDIVGIKVSVSVS